MSFRNMHDFVGELTGTFILVLFGCGSVAVTVLFGSHVGLFQVAIVWGIGVTLAIYATRHLSCAHLNPAISLAMLVAGRMSVTKMLKYWIAQFIGAFCAAAILYLLFSSSIAQYEQMHEIERGTPESIKTAMMFGEYYPNPGIQHKFTLSTQAAFLAEAMGTFLFAFLVFSLTEGCNIGRPDDRLAPLFIGLSVTAIISILAPLTQAGINPARDFAPRVFAYLAGWKQAALPDRHLGFLSVYILGPFAGSTAAALLFSKIIHPLMSRAKEVKDINETCP